MSLAVRAGVAAALSWLIAPLLPAPASDYPYYAPLGAVIATTFSLAGSVRESLQAVLAIAIGGTIALGADLLSEDSGPLMVAVVITLGVVAAGWRPLGDQGSWVPMAALFTLIIGQGEAFFVGTYAGLVLLGALVGLGVNLVFPPLPLAPVQEATREMRQVLVVQLRDTADLLARGEPPEPADWAGRRRDVEPARWRMRDAARQADEARRGNVRARRYAGAVAGELRQGEALDRLTTQVSELTDLLSEEERAGLEQVALGPALRPAAAEALRRLADALDSVRDGRADAEAHAAAEAARLAFVEQIDRHRTTSPGGGVLAAGTLAMVIQRCLESVPPQPDRQA
ncbi:hypothetical protein MF406_12440 [Georgenia sp. TF02-10]|uniref:hypothetical protein n=1 Tax=Georgenia sp. TF02-10 TaxID=2917725 RepID=UPI001FA78CC2|nr:hypothetical protein [Georgenia sp. TF02-10]UNX53784.1 hypothetical protein MF406_12440 [Georgenia sp. TF02-10]